MKLTALLLCILLLLCACTPAVPPPQPTAQPTATPQPTQPTSVPAEESAFRVYTDWSKLEEREGLPELISSRWYAEFTDALIPRDDYGPLIPYAGLRLMDDWPAETGCLYGLMTEDGTVVTDPVYSEVSALRGFGADGRAYVHPLLLLKGWDAVGSNGDPALYAVAARDGSWCTPLAYRTVLSNEELLLLFGQDSMIVMSPEGEITRVWTPEEMDVTPEERDAMLRDIYWHEGVAGELKGRKLALSWDLENPETYFGYHPVRYFDLDSGEILSCSFQEWRGLTAIPEWDNTGKAAAVPGAEWMPDILLGYDAPGLLCLREYGQQGLSRRYWLEDGTPLPQLSNRGEWYRQIQMVGGLIEDLDRYTASYYVPETMECVLRVYLNYETD